MYSLTLQYEISYNTLCNFLHYTMSSLTLTYVIAYTTLCNLLHFTIQYLTLHHVLSDPSLHCIAMITLLCPVPGTPHYSYSYRGSSGCELRYAHSLCDNVRCAVHYELCIVQCTVLWCALFSVLCSVCAVPRCGVRYLPFLSTCHYACNGASSYQQAWGAQPGLSPGLWGTAYNLHFTLYTLLYTLHSTLYTLHITLYTLHFTLYTLHSTLYT